MWCLITNFIFGKAFSIFFIVIYNFWISFFPTFFNFFSLSRLSRSCFLYISFVLRQRLFHCFCFANIAWPPYPQYIASFCIFLFLAFIRYHAKCFRLHLTILNLCFPLNGFPRFMLCLFKYKVFLCLRFLLVFNLFYKL